MQRLSELVDSFEVYALCLPCGRMEALPVLALLERYGDDLDLTQVRGRLRCQVCGERSNELRIVYVGQAGNPVVFHYRR